MTPAHLLAVTEWVTWVALGTGTPNAAEADTKIKTMAVMMGERYPDTRMFTPASATFVAHECGLMSLPAVGILGKLLEKWWAKNKPAQPALAAPGGAELGAASLSPEDRMAVQVWLERMVEHVLPASDMLLRLGVIRRYNEPGFRWLVAHNPDARAMAERNGWIHVPSGDDYTDPGRILASVRNILDPPHPQAQFWLNALRAAVERHAPELAGLVPLHMSDTEAGAAPETVARAPPAAPERPLGTMTREQLREAYEQAGKAGNPAATLRAAQLRKADKGANESP